ncbi:hypothetical protein D3C84_1085180 [compost metagenome]
MSGFGIIETKAGRLAIVRLQYEESECKWINLLAYEIIERIEITKALAHLLAVDKNMFVMNEGLGIGRTALSSGTLSDFVFMMRECKINTASMNIKWLAEALSAHD